MKKRFKIKKILIPIVVLGILLAPISPILKNNNGNLAVGIGMNKAMAADDISTVFASPSIEILDKSAHAVSGRITISVLDTYEVGNPNRVQDAYNQLNAVSFVLGKQGSDGKFTEGEPLPSSSLTQDPLKIAPSNFIVVTTDKILEPNTTYAVWVILGGGKTTLETIADISKWSVTIATVGFAAPVLAIPTGKNAIQNTPSTTFTTLSATDSNADKDLGTVGVTTTTSNEYGTSADFDYGCTAWPPTWFSNCMAAFTYYVFFQPAAAFAHLSAKILDFFVYYSTNSSSYSHDFINKAFGAVRDVANIFFIIALLYVAIKTILDIGVTNSKKAIGAIVIVALLINFSLFFTQIIIDGSNILAKVFYNQITPENENGGALGAGDEGEKSISVGLVKEFNPQKVINSNQYHGITENGTNNTNNSGIVGRTIFVNLLATGLMVFMIFIFISVAFLFVGRVVALWLSMIFAPLAFASYTIPGVNIPGFGHKEWWSELLKNAFLAPIFIFFLYIIILFGKFFTLITYHASTSAEDWLNVFMQTIIPFAIIFVLLKQAKKLAVEYSGEMGKAIISGAKSVGGFVGGAALGAVAFTGTKVIGGVSSKFAGSEGLQRAALEKKGITGWMARMAMKTTTAGSKATFDLRKTALGGAVGKGIGMDFGAAKMIGLGTKEGGFQGRAERGAKKIEEESSSYKTKLTDAQVAAGNFKNKEGNKITNAVGLNNFKQQQFIEKIGKNSLMSAMAYDTVKSLTDKKTLGDKASENLKKKGIDQPSDKELKDEKEKILDDNAKKVKLIVGGAALVGLGALTGGVGLGGGLAGLGIGAGAAGAYGAQKYGLEIPETERIAAVSLGKSAKQLAGVATRLKELGDLLKNQEKVFSDGKAKFGNVYGEDGKIDKTKLATEIASKELTQNMYKEKMNVLIKTIKDKEDKGIPTAGDEAQLKAMQETNPQSKEIKNMLELQQLKELEHIEEKINTTGTQIIAVRGPSGSTSETSSRAPTQPITPPTTK